MPKTQNKARITHIITDLNTGGAEMMLYKLLSAMDRERFQADVISLMDIGVIGQKIQGLGIPVRALGMRQGVPDPIRLFKLFNWLRKERPHCIQTWMYHADLMGGLATKMAGNIPIIWGIRHSDLNLQGSKKSTIWTAKGCAWLSRWIPAGIVCCSEASRRVHIRLGYKPEKMIVIPNGFDLSAFNPDPSAKADVRKELGIPEETILIGLIARFNPQKDHPNFIQAAAKLYAVFPNVHFLLCGEGVTWDNSQLRSWIQEKSLMERLHLLGRRTDIPRITASLDIASSSSSFGEGFPNIIGEAMACEVPCVVTDVGDSAYIVGDTGRVIQPRDPEALAEAWCDLIKMGPEQRKSAGSAARQRIQSHFNLPVIVRRYEELYRGVTDNKGMLSFVKHQ